MAPIANIGWIRGAPRVIAARLPQRVIHLMRTILTSTLITAALFASISAGSAVQQQPPLRLAIAGLVHGHVGGFLRGAQGRQDVQIVGVFDPDRTLLEGYAKQYKIPDSVLFTDLA